MRNYFSPTETHVLHILGKKKMTISEITDSVHDTEYRPLNARNKISSVIRRINIKCDFYKFNWFLDGEGLGRKGRTVWKKKR